MGIVSAIGIAVGASERSQAIQAAMIEAARQAQEEGVSDQDEIRRRMLAARDAVK